MLQSYLGTLKSLIYAAVFRIFTPTPATIRTPVLLIGIGTICLFYLLLRRISGRTAAIAGCLLLATDSVFLLTDLFDWGPVALQHLLLMGGMLALYRYYETERLAGYPQRPAQSPPQRPAPEPAQRPAPGCPQRPSQGLLYLAAGFFAFGLGMWDKALFIWSLTALTVAALAVFPRELWRAIRGRTVAVAGLAFCLGAGPLIVFNIDRRGETFRGAAVYSTFGLTNKLAMAANSLQGGELFGYLVRTDNDGAPPQEPRTPLAKASERVSAWFGHPRRSLMLVALAGAILLIPILLPARTRGLRTILFALVFLAVAWLAMALNAKTGGSVHHIVLLWPFPHIVVAVAFAEAAQQFDRAGRGALAVMLALVVPSNLLVTNEYYRLMLRNGGGIHWTDAIYPLSDFMQGVSATQIVVVDWGIWANLQLLHAGKLPLRIDADPPEKTALTSPGTVFVSHTNQYQVFAGVNQRLDAIAREAGLERESLGLFADRHGRQIFEVFRYK